MAFMSLLPGFIIERSHNTLEVFEKGAIERILSSKVSLYGFKIGFLQNLIFFVCCLYVFLFCNRIKIEYRQFLIPIFRNSDYRKLMGYFSWFLMVFIILKLNFEKQLSEFFKFCVFVLYCLIVTKH